ncbi:helix-turn-helix domain-containing protein [Desulfoferula mesophila]
MPKGSFSGASHDWARSLKQGKSVREVAEALGVSRSTA